MCGRFTLTADAAELQEAFAGFTFPSELAPRYNIAPTQPVLAIPNDGRMQAELLVWGLVPAWAKDAAIGSRLINARAETLAEKPSFRAGFKYKRCLIPADGFYEWKVIPGTKTKVPHYIQLTGGKPFALAGIWDEWRSPDGASIKTCTIITTEPNSLMAMIHNRMPVILKPEAFATWLDPAPCAPDSLNPLLVAYAPDQMTAHAVSTLVNRPGNDREECIAPA
jgi:putative SOS response-associated peptidase YedK